MGRKMILAAFGFLAMAAPMAFGIVRMIPIYGQILHASGPLPSFEVVTIRPWRPPPPPPPPPPSDGATAPRKVSKVDPGPLGGQSTDRVHVILETKLLILFAYNLPFGSEKSRIVGGPEWLRTDQYDIQAKIEDSLYAAMQKMTPAQQREQVNLMEQSLLAERFKLKVHFETREMPVYALVVAKGGPKLTAAKDGESSKLYSLPDNEQGSEMIATAVTLDQFVHSPLWGGGGRLVIDQTGLTGKYDFTLKWGSDKLLAAGADAPSVFTAIQEQLGLKLVPSNAPVEVIIIDQVEKPSEN
jgi:bla regulator protein blaR1